MPKKGTISKEKGVSSNHPFLKGLPIDLDTEFFTQHWNHHFICGFFCGTWKNMRKISSISVTKRNPGEKKKLPKLLTFPISFPPGVSGHTYSCWWQGILTISTQLGLKGNAHRFGVKILLMEEIRLTSWYGKYPIIYKVLYIPGGVGFQPSTVW